MSAPLRSAVALHSGPLHAGQKPKPQQAQTDGRKAPPRRSESMTGVTGLAAISLLRPAGADRASPRGKRDAARGGGGPQLRGRGSLAGVAEQDKLAASPRRGRSQVGPAVLQIGNGWSSAAQPQQQHQQAAPDRSGPLLQRSSVARRMSNSRCALAVFLPCSHAGETTQWGCCRRANCR